MKWGMGSLRLWLFRVLVVVVAGFMVASAIMPWWVADVDSPSEEQFSSFTIEIYQYGIHRDAEGFTYFAEDVTPFYQTVFAWIYISASVGLILYSTWLRGRKGRWLLGGIGLIYIAYAAIAAFAVIANRAGEAYGLSLQGTSIVVYEEEDVFITTSLQLGYYLAYAFGLTCIALAFLRNIIIGKPKLSA